MDADDFLAQLEADENYQRRRRKHDAEQRELQRRLIEAERPIVDDLRAAGIDVDDIYDLEEVASVDRVAAVPIILGHLQGRYASNTIHSLARLLDFPGVKPWWDDLRTLYLAKVSDAVRDGLANTMSGQAKRAEYEDLVMFVGMRRLGDSRIYFLRPINRIGNRISPGQGRAVIAGLADDPVLGREATAILKGRGHNE